MPNFHLPLNQQDIASELVAIHPNKWQKSNKDCPRCGSNDTWIAAMVVDEEYDGFNHRTVFECDECDYRKEY